MAENDQGQAAPAATEQANPENKFGLQRIYIKDSSFEAPDTPDCFRKAYNPHIDLSLGVHTAVADEESGIFEVTLKITANVKQDDKTVFLVEVHQAGLFEIKGFNEQQMPHVLNIACPNILFPYGREAIDSMISKGSFPPLMLAQVNFDQVYQQAQQQNGAQESDVQVPAS